MKRISNTIAGLLMFILVSIAFYGTSQERLNHEAWQEATEGVDYTEEKIEEEEKEQKEFAEEEEEDSVWSFPMINSQVLSVVFISIIIIALAFIIAKLLGVNIGFGRARVKNNLSFSLEEIEENLTETDLEQFRREALENRDFKTAIRIQYLMIIKQLSELGKIEWKREKTNRHYVLEMRLEQDYRTFRDLTRSFEIVWYGEAPISADQYQKLYPEFNQYLKSLEDRRTNEK